MPGLAITCGAVVGFALGLTGGGGGIFAVPLLVYVLSVPPREAIGISLASVGGTALAGVIPRWMRGEVEVPTGAVFAFGGIWGAPVGNRMSNDIPEMALMSSFGVLMFVIAVRMWSKANQLEASASQVVPANPAETDACHRDTKNQRPFTPVHILLLICLGFVTGILSGLFGVGGGFVIVPVLVLWSGMSIHSAIATSLMVIALVSLSGVLSYLMSGGTASWQTTSFFLVGGLVGMSLGSATSKRMAGAQLQRIFSIAIIAVGMFVLTHTYMSL